MIDKNKRTILIVSVVIILIAVLSFIFIMKGSDLATIEVVENQEGLNENATSTPGTTPTGTVVKPALTYQQALNLYQDVRLQINDCVMLPSSVTYKNGTTVMIDNRGAQSAVVNFDKKIVNLSAYQFKIITLKSNTTPHEVKVDCKTDSTNHFNIGQILLQK